MVYPFSCYFEPHPWLEGSSLRSASVSAKPRSPGPRAPVYRSKKGKWYPDGCHFFVFKTEKLCYNVVYISITKEEENELYKIKSNFKMAD